MHRSLFCAVLIVIIMTGSVVWHHIANYQCTLKDGLLVSGIFKYECVQKVRK